ncbi:hypothetical protein E4T56_gene19293 [Termitomyces sp. T112]|nr:hypothetical protein E4T56_gene19293 [Termitomyces sp. T112]
MCHGSGGALEIPRSSPVVRRVAGPISGLLESARGAAGNPQFPKTPDAPPNFHPCPAPILVSPNATPANSDTTPANSDASPANSDASPANSDASPANSDASPANSDASPANSDASLANSDGPWPTLTPSP